MACARATSVVTPAARLSRKNGSLSVTTDLTRTAPSTGHRRRPVITAAVASRTTPPLRNAGDVSSRLTPAFEAGTEGPWVACARATSVVTPAARLSRKNGSFSVTTDLNDAQGQRPPTPLSRRRG